MKHQQFPLNLTRSLLFIILFVVGTILGHAQPQVSEMFDLVSPIEVSPNAIQQQSKNSGKKSTIATGVTSQSAKSVGVLESIGLTSISSEPLPL